MSGSALASLPEVDEPAELNETARHAAENAEERLALLLPELVSDELRAEAVRVARVTAMATQVQSWAAKANTAVQEAIGRFDTDAFLKATARLVIAERAGAMLPDPTFDQAVVTASFNAAGRWLLAAEHAMPDLPEVAYTAEMAAWWSMPVPMQTQFDPPVVEVVEREAQKLIDSLAAERKQVDATTVSWYRVMGSVDLIDHLRAAAGAAEMCVDHGRRCAVVAKTVNEVNVMRRKARLLWSCPANFNSPQVAHMLAHRSRITGKEAA